MQRSEADRILLWLASIDGIGPKRYYKLMSLYPDPLELWDEIRESNGHLNFLGAKLKADLIARRSEAHIEQVEEMLARHGVQAVLQSDYEYPQSLREIVDPPAILFVKGNMDLLTSRCIGIVGSRRCSRYGREVARDFGVGIAESGITVVSGMARGIDTEAHKAALSVKDGTTIAVLGCGVDVIYPPENRALYEEIVARGAVISEYYMGTAPLAQHFPARNRIISGLSESVLLAEADIKSGAMITVDYALEQGKEVYCVPGNIYSSYSRGTNYLIKNGANMATEVADIVNGYYNSAHENLPFNQARQPIELDEQERKIVDWLLEGSMSTDELIARTGISAPEMATLLTMMELRGIIKKLPGGTYCIEGKEYT